MPIQYIEQVASNPGLNWVPANVVVDGMSVTLQPMTVRVGGRQYAVEAQEFTIPSDAHNQQSVRGYLVTHVPSSEVVLLVDVVNSSAPAPYEFDDGSYVLEWRVFKWIVPAGVTSLDSLTLPVARHVLAPEVTQ